LHACRSTLEDPQNAEERVKRLVESLGGYVASKPRGAGVAEIVQKLLPT
jgi:hypothetical protein